MAFYFKVRVGTESCPCLGYGFLMNSKNPSVGYEKLVKILVLCGFVNQLKGPILEHDIHH